ncbi:GlcG/HbpS family heme-binding protein [Streptomyces cyanogenus]|uniref:Heme-binding protein n=1 Tax=Streptomyces cyanogenus TaxID=80860 RepID=A0ABX7U4T0_STRCY|nr:heme-binding protein [Streptomyces cyanogenus]QTE02812.1 hypothetical protein S1361_36100 [Streptomyces cyanogenus]
MTRSATGGESAGRPWAAAWIAVNWSSARAAFNRYPVAPASTARVTSASVSYVVVSAPSMPSPSCRSTRTTSGAVLRARASAVQDGQQPGGYDGVVVAAEQDGPQSYESAQRKAFTAVSWNAPTSELAGRLAQAPNRKDIPGTLFLAGGTPVTAQGAPVAGIGVAGAPSGDLDERYAGAGAAVLGR